MLVGPAKEVSAGAGDHQCCRVLAAVRESQIGRRVAQCFRNAWPRMGREDAPDREDPRYRDPLMSGVP